MSKNIIISESKLISLIKMVINEDPYVKTNYPHTHAKKKEGDELFPEILKYYLETGSTVKELSQKFNLPYHTINTRLTKYFKELSNKKIHETLIMNENYYEPDKLYDTEYVISILKKAPRHLKSLLNKLDDIPCKNSKGESKRCTKIPAVLHAYMWDR